jgi:hypothetical protein
MPERASTGPLLPITLEQIEFALFGRVVSDEERCWYGPVQDARIGELASDGLPTATAESAEDRS